MGNRNAAAERGVHAVSRNAAAERDVRVENRNAAVRTDVRAARRDRMQDGMITRSHRLQEITAMIRTITLVGETRDRAAVKKRRTHKGTTRRVRE